MVKIMKEQEVKEMALEKEGYRDNLERIVEFFPGKEMLTVGEVSKFLGLDPRTAKKMFKFNDFRYISVASLARQMC